MFLWLPALRVMDIFKWKACYFWYQKHAVDILALRVFNFTLCRTRRKTVEKQITQGSDILL